MASFGGSSYVTPASIGAVSLAAFNAHTAVFNGIAALYLAVLNTWVDTGTGITGGLYIFRDMTSGGVAVFVADSAAGAVPIVNGITGFQMRYSGSQMQIQITTGLVPRSINMTVVAANLV